MSDTRAGNVFRVDLDGKVTLVADVPSRPFGLGFLPDGELLVASMTKRLILNFGNTKPAIHADMADIAVGYLRDMAVARDGNAYVTSFDADAGGPDGFASAKILLATPATPIQLLQARIAVPQWASTPAGCRARGAM